MARKSKKPPRRRRAGRISAIGGQSASAGLLKLGLPGEWSFDPATEQQFVQGQVSPICKWLSTGNLKIFLRPSPRRAVVLRDPPVAAAPDEHPSHPVRRRRIAVGEIYPPGRDGDVRFEFPHTRHRVRLHANGWRKLAEI